METNTATDTSLQKNLDFEHILNTLKCGVLIINYKYKFSIEYANDYFYELIGYTKTEYNNLFKDNIIARVYPDDLQKLKSNISRQISMGGVIRFEFRIIKKDGSIAWILLNGIKHSSDTLCLYASFTDITELKTLYNDIAEKNFELDTIYNNINGGLIKLSITDMRVFYANDGFFNFIGYTKEEFLHKYNNMCTDIIHPDDISSLYDIIEKGLKKTQITFRILHKNNSIKWACLNASRIGSFDGKPVYLCTVVDITENKNYEQQLVLEQKKQYTLTKLSGEWIWEYDILEKKLIRSSDNYTIFDSRKIVYNYKESMLEKDIIHKDDIDIFNTFCTNLASGRENFETEFRMRNKETHDFSWYKLVATTLYDTEGDAICVIGKTKNIDSTHETITALQDQVTKDSLTNCYNRTTIQDLIEENISNETFLPYALIVLDIDNFRVINDSLGRLFGDSLLIEVANILNKCFNDCTIGRVGTDVFTIFVKSIKNKSSLEDILKNVSKEFSKIYVGDNDDYTITCSIGIVLSDTIEPSFEVLFKKADIALYTAKNQGRNRYLFYDSSLGFNTNEHTLNEYNMENSFSSLQASIDTALLTNAIDLLFGASDTISSIKVLFTKMRAYFKCDYISLVTLKQSKSGNYIQKDVWVPNISRISRKKASCPKELVEQHSSLFNIDNLFYCSELSKIKDYAPDVYNLFSQNKTISLLQCANVSNEEFKGYITLGNCSEKCSWSVSEVRTFSMLCKVIFSTIVKIPIK